MHPPEELGDKKFDLLVVGIQNKSLYLNFRNLEIAKKSV